MWRRKRQPGLVVVALCLGGALTACGGSDDGEGYAAVGAGQTVPKGAVPPSGTVTLVPLDPKATGPELTSSTSRPSPRPSGGTGSRTGTVPGGTATAPPPVSGAPAPPRTPGSPATTPAKPPTTSAPSPAPTSTAPPPTKPPAHAPAPAPALLTLSAPVLTDTDKRWCENVTLTFRNTGGTAARSGTVTFATHVIGALGIDWATLTSSQSLPAPIQAGATRTQTYTVCVDSWRVPLGMHVDTQKVTAAWQ
ncbi:hypothetical protein KV205_00630 [Streptomyces sp. SKN60]|uniref:hypothetical protein n=1 Tax=Streptomyces sp. SKN60 TaxID=2855506 RepID=UPI0022463536|nr:hypothetical protein [Streptomyces sp. SKN60]MCX2179042.1 hypothetical protein [Streptomyces sp. SKN60]